MDKRFDSFFFTEKDARSLKKAVGGRLNVQYVQLGEQRGIGATMHYINYGGKNVAADCGIGFQRSGEANIKIIPSGNFLKGTRIDLILITHAHVDHVGAIPRLVAEHPEAVVFISDPAYDIAEVMLNDSLKIYESEWRNFSNVTLNDNEYEMLFDEKDLGNFLNSGQVEPIESPCWIEPWPGWRIGMYWAGHAKGAMMYMLSAPGERPLFITGDVASHDQEKEFVPGVMLPPDEFTNGFFDGHDAIMITEGTNGNKPMPQMTRRQTKEKLITTVKEVMRRGGIPFFPTYAQTKSSNIAMMMVEAGIVPHIDGLARKLAPLEIPNFQELVDSGKLVLIEDDKEKGDYHRRMLVRGEDPCGHERSPIISPSASLDMGRAVYYARYLLPDTKNALIFTGYTFPGSRAKQILEIERGRTIVLRIFNRGEVEKVPVNVRCDVHHFELTSHDYADPLVERARRVRPRDVIIHHCEKNSFNALAAKIAALDNPPRSVNWGRHKKKFRL